MAESLNVYQKWLGIPLHQQPPNSYRLLGLELFEADLDTIAHAADRQMAHVRTLSVGEYANQAQQLLNEIAAARVKLLNPQKKATYDALLHADLVGQQGQPYATSTAVGNDAPPDIETELEEPIEPVWRNPLVLGTAGICFVLVVAICTAMYLRSRPKEADTVAQTVPPVEKEPHVSPGELAAVPVDEEEEILPSDPSPIEKPSEVESAAVKEDPFNVPPTDPVPLTPNAQQPSTQVVVTSPKTEPEDTAVAKVDPAVEVEEVDPDAFTEDDPGPPEPLDDGRPYTRPRWRRAVPSKSDQAQVLAKVKEIFHQEYADVKSPEQKRELAKFLIQQVQSIQDDPTSEFVLLSEAHYYGKDGGDLQFTVKTIEQLERNFLVDGLQMKVDLLNDYAREAKNVQQRQTIADFAIWVASEAAKGHKFDTAEKLATQAQSMAVRLGNDRQREKARDLIAEYKKRKVEWIGIQAAIDKLDKDADDAQAHLVYGKYLCLEEKDWNNGLEHLSQSSDQRLSALAKQDLAEPTNPEEQIALADAWHEVAAASEEFTNFGYREHYWYLKAFPETTGLLRTKIERRLRDNKLVRFRDSWLSIPSQAESAQRN